MIALAITLVFVVITVQLTHQSIIRSLGDFSVGVLLVQIVNIQGVLGFLHRALLPKISGSDMSGNGSAGTGSTVQSKLYLGQDILS